MGGAIARCLWLLALVSCRFRFTPEIDDGASCVPETDVELCARISGCEPLTAVDNCGASRSLDCGACATGLGCVGGTCKTPLCAGLGTTATYGATVDPFTLSNTYEGWLGASSDGNTRVWGHDTAPNQCSGWVVEIRDADPPGSQTFVSQPLDVTAAGFLQTTGFSVTTDGLTLFGVGPDLRHYVTATRSARMTTDWTPSGTDLDLINQSIATDASATFGRGQISADGLRFYYVRLTSTDATQNGFYESIRATASAQFPVGVRMPEEIQTGNTGIDGVSADGLTLFLDACPTMPSDCWYTRLATRTSLRAPFTNPNAPGPMPQLKATTGYVWQHIPVGDCSRILAVTSPGGCFNQDVEELTRQ